MTMDILPATVGSRSLLQAPESSSTNLPKNINCSGAVCLIFNILVVVIILVVAFCVLLCVLFKKWRMRKAISVGSIPAKFLISQWTVPPKERGDLAAFSFPLRRPMNREEINEESCPICLGTKPKPSSWLIFGACNHATCRSCFKKLVSEKKLLAACPICRTLLVQGDGSRGGPTPKPSIEQPVEALEPTTTTDAPSAGTLPPSDNNV